jgi:2-polyprenyl-3-methyl-5-hydroxy-6-metoxy-1,4-benzoquinol methylase
MSTHSSVLNRDSYNAIAAHWDAARPEFFGREADFVEALLEGLAPASHILDLGCGTGRPLGSHLLARGHRVTGVDQAESLLALARRRHPEATWIESTLQAFDTPERFAAVVCWDALFHIERPEHAGLFARMAGMLEPGGRLMVTVGGSEHPAFTDTMFGKTFFYDSHAPEEALVLLALEGFTPLLTEFLNPPTSGRDKGRYAILARLA